MCKYFYLRQLLVLIIFSLLGSETGYSEGGLRQLSSNQVTTETHNKSDTDWGAFVPGAITMFASMALLATGYSLGKKKNPFAIWGINICWAGWILPIGAGMVSVAFDLVTDFNICQSINYLYSGFLGTVALYASLGLTLAVAKLGDRCFSR